MLLFFDRVFVRYIDIEQYRRKAKGKGCYRFDINHDSYLVELDFCRPNNYCRLKVSEAKYDRNSNLN